MDKAAAVARLHYSPEAASRASYSRYTHANGEEVVPPTLLGESVSVVSKILGGYSLLLQP